MGCSSFLQPALQTFRPCGEVRLYVRRTNIAQPRRPEIGDQMTLDQTDIGQLIGVDVNERLLVGGGLQRLHRYRADTRSYAVLLGFLLRIGQTHCAVKGLAQRLAVDIAADVILYSNRLSLRVGFFLGITIKPLSYRVKV